MEAAVLWKAAMRPRLPTGLGKRRQEPAGVSHSSHSPCYWKREPRAKAEAGQTTLRLTSITNPQGGIISWPTGGKVGWPLTRRPLVGFQCLRLQVVRGSPERSLHLVGIPHGVDRRADELRPHAGSRAQ